MTTNLSQMVQHIADRPVIVAALGAGCIASSGVLVRLADTSPVNVAFFRCLYALPVLGLLSALERQKTGSLPRKTTMLAWVAGVFFATDLILWHNAIDAVGAGLATVLGNLQVVIVGFAAWALLGERPHSSLFAAVPVVLVGVVLISGVIGDDAYGKDPGLGVIFGVATSIAYAAFILILRQGATDRRKVAGPLFHATLASALVALGYGLIFGGLSSTTLQSHGWMALLALTAQVSGWLLISHSLPRLPAAITSIVLLLQPVGAMIIARIVLDEIPGWGQVAGAILILAGVVGATLGHRRSSRSRASEPAI